MTFPIQRRGATNGNFRIAYPPYTKSGKPSSVRFRLSGNWTIETLHVFREYLIASGKPWLYLMNRDATRLPYLSLRAPV